MKKYKIGLLVLALLVAGLAVYIISQGMKSKVDKQTFDAAQEIAEDLNTYISKNREVPDSLEEAGISDLPSTIKYEKNSSSEYEFCVTYNTDKSYGNDFSSVLYGAASGSMIDTESFDYEYEADYAPSSLYINYFYQKGENCQTVKPRITSSVSEDTESLYELYCSEAYRSTFETYCAQLEEQEITNDIEEL